MAKTLLRSGCLDDFLSLGENGQTVFDSALQIRETLRLRRQQAVVASLAIPQPNDEGDRVDWYAPYEGTVVSWAAASEEQRKNALRYLDNCRANVASLSQRCQQAEKTAIQLFGSLLANALQFPGSQHVYLIDGKPVLTFWGFVTLNSNARPDPLDCLRNDEEHEPVIERLPEPPPTAPPVLVLSEPDEPLCSVAVQTPAPPPIEVPLAEAVPESKPAKKTKRWLLPAATVAIAGIAAPLTYYLVSAPHAEPVAQVAAKPQAIAPAALQAEPVAHVSTLPVALAEVVEPPVPQPEPVAVDSAPVAAVSKGALILPPDSLKIGSTKFLNGSWRVTINVQDAITGKPPTLRYQIASNKGSVRLVHGDNIACKAEVFSGLMQSGTLMIKTRGNARCSDGSRYPLPEISCKPGENGVAECSGRYANDTVVPVTFKKVDD
ncbi:ssrAB-activated protein [Buttiauxella warmboldiae]|uniref:SsrAB-activated protein n=1 Tax=Buttiauxella warmboldiae TaxID=82993 RepID=A0A3N5DC05_9ENTR|nr:SrfA family protein [Buttiauxella warmboldiae]RPH24791.1 ssrAB-activated protein [Buttiauxella warmboldiae]